MEAEGNDRLQMQINQGHLKGQSASCGANNKHSKQEEEEEEGHFPLPKL